MNQLLNNLPHFYKNVVEKVRQLGWTTTVMNYRSGCSSYDVFIDMLGRQQDGSTVRVLFIKKRSWINFAVEFDLLGQVVDFNDEGSPRTYIIDFFEAFDTRMEVVRLTFLSEERVVKISNFKKQ